MNISRGTAARSALAVALLFFAGRAFGSSIQYTITTYNLPGFTPIAISGDYIAGDLTVGGVVHAALLHNGSLTDLGAGPGGVSATVLGVNSAGQVVGQTGSGQTGSPRAILWSGGTATDITPQGMTAAAATGINSSGQVVGINYTNPNAYADSWFVENLSGGSTAIGGHDFLDASGGLVYPGADGLTGTYLNANGDVLASPFYGWESLDIGGTITTIEPSTYFYGAVTGLNDSGEVIGSSEGLSDSPFGYSYDPNTAAYTNLGFCPTGINDAGTIVGDQTCNPNGATGEVRIAGQNYLLSQIVSGLNGATMYWTVGINAEGQILGYGTDSTGAPITYLLTQSGASAPEPTAWLLFGGGLVAVLFAKPALRRNSRAHRLRR